MFSVGLWNLTDLNAPIFPALRAFSPYAVFTKVALSMVYVDVDVE